MNILLTYILYCDAGPGGNYNCLKIQYVSFLSRISYMYMPACGILRRRRGFTSRKLCAGLKKFLCFLQLSGRAYVSAGA